MSWPDCQCKKPLTNILIDKVFDSASSQISEASTGHGSASDHELLAHGPGDRRPDPTAAQLSVQQPGSRVSLPNVMVGFQQQHLTCVTPKRGATSSHPLAWFGFTRASPFSPAVVAVTC